jgi:ubiquinone/menaquinone biosynthesis C-methylase UbiE
MEPINYSHMADVYARNRPANSFVVDELGRRCSLDSSSRVLEVGCGTGSHVLMLIKATSCQGWGIDPSEEMICQEESGGKVQFVNGTAEELPFEDKFFDFLFSIDVIHHVTSTKSYFHEAFRVLKSAGTICTITDSERIIRNRKPLSQYWPSTVSADIKRYPTITVLKKQMIAAGFVDVTETNIKNTSEVKDITPYKEMAFSCLHLISQDEFLRGLMRLQEDLKAGPVQRVSAYVCLWGRFPAL